VIEVTSSVRTLKGGWFEKEYEGEKKNHHKAQETKSDKPDSNS